MGNSNKIVNCGATILCNIGGFSGCMIKDSNGNFMGASSRAFLHQEDPLVLEALAVAEGIKRIWIFNILFFGFLVYFGEIKIKKESVDTRHLLFCETHIFFL